MNAHDTEVMAGILQALGYTATEDINEAGRYFDKYMCDS